MPTGANLHLLGTRESLKCEYWCFISYSHTDNKVAGRQWANWLHQILETYEIPEELIETENDYGDTIPERLFPIFRDEEELRADSDLSGAIQTALERSRFLLVLCSPMSAQSPYVSDEIRYFKQLGKGKRIIAAIISGQPNASEAVARSSDEECFPHPLRFAVTPDGRVTDEPAQPIAADFRTVDGLAGWNSPVAYRQFLQAQGHNPTEVDAMISEYSARSRLMLFKILAAILGVPMSVLTKRDHAYQLEKERSRLRMVRRVASTFAALLILAIVGGLCAYWQRQEARAALSRVEQQLHEAANSDLVRADTLLKQDEPYLSLCYLSRAVKYDPSLFLAFQQAAIVLNQISPAIPKTLLKTEIEITHIALLLGTEFVFIDGEWFNPCVYDLKNHRVVLTLPDLKGVARSKYYPSSNTLVLLTHDRHLYQVNVAEAAQTVEPIGDILDVSFLDDDVTFAKADTSGNVVISFLFHDRSPIPLPHSSLRYAHFGVDGSKIITSDLASSAVLWDLKAGHPKATMRLKQSYERLELVKDSSHIVGFGINHTITVWNHNGDRISNYEGIRAAGAIISPDGTRVVYLDADFEKGVSPIIFDLDTGERHETKWWGCSMMSTPVFSHDGKRFLTAAQDYTVRIWDAASGKYLCSLIGHEGPITQMWFSDDDSTITTVSRDGTVRNWDGYSPPLLLELGRGRSYSRLLGFDKEGSHFAFEESDFAAEGESPFHVFRTDTGILEQSYTETEFDLLRSSEFVPQWNIGTNYENPEDQFLYNLVPQCWPSIRADPYAPIFSRAGSEPDIVLYCKGTRLASMTEQKVVRIWSWPGNGKSVPHWASDFLTLLARQKIAPNGEIDKLSAEEDELLLSTLARELEGGKSQLEEFARWFLTPRISRPSQPGAPLKFAELADVLITGDADSSQLERAYDLWPGNPILHLALAMHEENPARAAHLRSISRGRLKSCCKDDDTKDWHSRAKQFDLKSR